MIDEWNPDEEFNVMIFQKHVKEIMEDIYNRGKIPIMIPCAQTVGIKAEAPPAILHVVAPLPSVV